MCIEHLKSHCIVVPSNSGAFAEGSTLGTEYSYGTVKQRVAVKRGEGSQYVL